MSRVLVCIASRDRNLALDRALTSISETSIHADVAVYIDEDQREMYREVVTKHRPALLVGPRLGPCTSLNRLVEEFMGEHVAVGAATDDCTFISPRWDEWVISEVQRMPQQLGMLAPVLPGSKRMDFPWASRRWIEEVGYLAPPQCHHYYWDVVLEVLAEAIHISRAAPEQFSIAHDDAPGENLSLYMQDDAMQAIMWCAFERPRLLRHLKGLL